ncbi:MAG TPA: LysM peptidoglycan-binding domain-containing protein [Pyrinomonadaceae bacterium]|nr:LysM peptidoglycan-binding domain-containing protein [Pyrinomonadaceae bacterium]
MDLNQIQTILQDNTVDGTLTLPPAALESIPIAEAFRDYLLDSDLIINQVSIVPVGGENITAVGQGGSFPFENTYVTAVFTVRNDVAAMTIDSDGFSNQQTIWNFSAAFPVLSDTFFKDLQFTKADFTLRSSNASVTQPGGLFFNGKQQLTGTLAVISQLLNQDTEVSVQGPIILEGEKTPEKVVPVMVLEDPKPGSALEMEFIYQLLDGFRIAIKRPPETGTSTLPVPQMQMISRITVDSDQGSQSVDIATHFTTSFTLLTFEADMDQLLVVTQAALNKLARGANIGSVLPSQLPLVNRFELGQWSMSVIPQVPQITSISMGAGIVEPWTVIPGLFTLQKIDFSFTINYVNEKYEPNAALTAKIRLLDGDAAFNIDVDAQYPSYVINGFLEEETPIDLIAFVKWILGDQIASSLPCKTLKVTTMTLLIDPRNSTYTFETVIKSDCSFDIYIATFNLTQINFNFSYVAGEATGSFVAGFWLIPPQLNVAKEQWLIDDPPPGAIGMEVSAAYNGAEEGWSFRGGLAPEGEIDLETIIGLYLPPEYTRWIPSVVITQLEAGFETGTSQAYDFSIGAEWTIGILNTQIGALVKISSALDEDGERQTDGEVQGFLRFGGDPEAEEGGLEFRVTAKFNALEQVYIFEFLGWTATLRSNATEKKLTFNASHKTLGEMIEVLINAVIPGADIKLAAPWNVLNSVPLGNFTFEVVFAPEDSSPKTASLSYAPNINLGFAKIGKLELEYEVATEKVWFRITEGEFLGKKIDPKDPVKWDVADPDTTEPVPGKGSELFRLEFLGLGQHMGVADKTSGALQPVPASIFGAVTQLNDAFTNKNNLTLVFNEASDWLLATRFMVVQAVELGIVFYDPELFGLVVSVTGSKAAEKLPIFNGLVFEILYKKINDTIGMWQIDLTLPFYIRNLQFGAVSVTLPSMKVQIYTNGDFMIDLGFPANDDFTRSFSVQALPFVGSGGVYFGKLSSATSDRVPKTQNGNFSPVIAFGIGLRIGLGKDLDYGVLKAGMSVTIQGVLEGVFAWYNPYPGSLTSGSNGNAQLVPAASRQLTRKGSNKLAASASGDDFYYMIQARVSLVGKIYGSVDLKIITADLDVEIRVSIRLTLEAYRAIDIFFEARISLTLRVRINLGLFKITIRLSFKMEMSFSFTIGSNSLAPWDKKALRQNAFMLKLDAAEDEECPVIPVMKWQPLLTNNPVRVPLLFVPQFTAATDGPLGAGSPRKPYVVAMTYVSSTAAKLSPPPPAPFDEIARGALLWTLNAYLNSGKEGTTLDELLRQDISIEQLNEIYCYLTQKNMTDPFTENEVFEFLKHFFRFEMRNAPEVPPAGQVVLADEDVSIFPIMPLMRLTTSSGIEVDFFTKTPASNAYLEEIKKYFAELAVRYKSPAEKASQQSFATSSEATDKSLASFIFLDFFAMLARSTVQDAISLLQKQEAPLAAAESLAQFVIRRPELGHDVSSIALANVKHPLRGGVELRVPGAVYTVKRGDTVQSIAAKVNHDIVKLRTSNPLLKGKPPEPATQINLPDATFRTSDDKPESLLDISRMYGVSVADLAVANQHVAGLFPAGTRLLAPFAQQMNIGELANSLQANESFNNLSGLAARVLLQGLRPPSPKESPQAGNPAPLYELTGQQFDGSDLVSRSTITLTVPEDVSTWFKLGDGNSLTYTLSDATAEALAKLKLAPFGPAVTFEPAKLLRIEPRRFTLPTGILWHTPVAVAMTNRNDERPADTIEPYLWQFPSELMEVIIGPQALQPKVELWTQRQESPGQTYPKEPVTNYTWSTVIDIQVRQTASGEGVFLPHTYEMTGIDAGGNKLLENLLVWYAESQFPKIEKIRVLFPPDPAVPGQDAPPTGLRSEADPTFFLLQTNLSTASQPPQFTAAMALQLAAADPQRDPLGQSDIEFLKLLWESSVVNSGGYVLYYEAEKRGLPDYLFSQDGVARLTLLVTYTITDNVLRNFMNNVVIHQVIDTENEVLYAQPVPQTVSNFMLGPGESLADVASRYRVTVSQLATQYNNAHSKLTSGRHLRIPPVTYRVRAGESLDAIATRANVTAREIADLNSPANANDLSQIRFLRLPETVWRSRAEDSLASLAERFSTTVVTLAHANKNVPGLIEGTLQFDDRLEEAIPAIPAGNIAFKFERAETSSDSPIIEPTQQLAELYNLVGYRLTPVNGFEATNSALPISPNTDKPKWWVYESVVPVFPFVPPPPDTGDNTPNPRENPYNGVGNTAVVNFNWQDLFGNWIESSVNNQSWPDQGFAVGYIDNLIALDQWPAVTSDYVIARAEGGAPELGVTLRFNADLYLPEDDPEAAREMALTDLGKFRTIYYQLTQPDVRVTLSSTMQGSTVLKDASSPLSAMVQFVLDIINFLTHVSEGLPEPPRPIDRAMSQPVADQNTKNLFALVVRLEIKRNLDLVNDEFKDIPSVSVVTSRVPANAGQDNAAALKGEPAPPLSLQEFAERLETAFPSLKVLVAAPKKGLGQVAEEIWIVRLAPTQTGIAFTIDGQSPLFFAVEPLAGSLLSRPDVLVYPYQSGRFIGNEIPIKTSQNSINLDQMGRDFLAAVEQVLGPQFSASTWKLEYDSGAAPPVSDPPNPQTTPYEAIVWAKETLANAISRHITNVFEQNTPADALADARETARQQLLIDLTSAYTVDVFMQYPVAVTHSQYAEHDLFAPRLFGKPVTENPDDPNDVEKKNAYSFSTGKFSLAKRTTGAYLTVSFATNREQQGRDGKQFDDVFTIDLLYQINALEHEIHPVKGIDGYLASSWLTFVLPDSFETPGEHKILVPLGEQTIPVPLRAYPTPPSLNEQTFAAHVKQFVGDPLPAANGEEKLLKARLWDYRCQYEYVGAAHDKILADIKLNVPPGTLLKAQFNDADNPDLFAALVQFTAAYPGIARDLDQYLATGTDNQKAFSAISSFAWLAQRAAKAWMTWDNTAALYNAQIDSPEYHFVISQHGQDQSGVKALIVTVAADGPGPRLQKLPKVEIQGYKTEVLTQTPELASYYFVGVQDQTVLTYEIGRNLSSRHLLFTDFDILKVETAWAGAAVKRNENLLPDETTNPAFVFQSPVVRFVNVLTPLLDPIEEIDIADFAVTKPEKLAQYLSDFLIAFFEAAQTAGNENRTVRLGAAYGYKLEDSGEADTQALLPDLDILLPILLTTPTSISILRERLGPDSTFIKAVADTINMWFATNKPNGVEESGRLWFDLSVYSSLSESQLPVLRMRRLFLATKLIVFPT